MQLKFHKLLILLGLWLSCLPFSMGQNSLTNQLTEEVDSTDWKREFWGWKGDLLSYRLTLEKKGEHVRGYYSYDSSEDTFYVEGMLDGKAMWLEERFQEVEDCGLFQGKFDGTTFEGTWTGSSALGILTTCFYAADSILLLPIHPSVITFNTKLKGLDGKWVLYTDYQKNAQGIFISTQKEVFQIKLQSISRLESQGLLLNLILLNDLFEPVHKVTLDLNAKKANQNGVDFPLFKIKSALQILRKQEADFHQLRVNIMIPAIDKDLSVMKIFRDTSCNLNYRKRYASPFRGGIFSANTFYPTLIHNKIVSGLYTKHTVHEGESCMGAMAVNYKKKADRLLNLEKDINDTSRWTSDLKSFLTHHLDKIKKSHPQDLYWQSLSTDDFKYLALSEAGLLAMKGQDPYLGVLFIAIPSELIEQHFDKKSIVFTLMKSKIKV